MARRPKSDPAIDTEEPDGGTAHLGFEAQVMLRLDRVEKGLRENRADVRTVIDALEGRTRVSEKCIAVLSTVIAGVLQPSKGLIALAVLAAIVLAPGSLVLVANSDAGTRIADAVVARLVGPAMAASPEPVDEP